MFIPNIITTLRILGAAVLLLCNPASVAFWVIYGLCGVSDMADGYLARRLHAESKAGAVLDSVADICFVVVKQYLENPKASIYFYHKGLIRYEGVMLKGTMEVLTDQETKNMIWRKGDTVFYKQGVTDPDYCVLKFTAATGRHYRDLKTGDFSVDTSVHP